MNGLTLRATAKAEQQVSPIDIESEGANDKTRHQSRGGRSCCKRTISLLTRRRSKKWWFLWMMSAISFSKVFYALVIWEPDSFSLQESLEQLPNKCHEYAARFHQCQQESNHTLVIGCHRKWCNSFGYCSPGGGLGSRTRYTMTMIQHAVMEMCIRVEIDAPSNAVLFADDVTFRDPMGLLADWFHFRSYGRLVEDARWTWQGNVSDWVKHDKFFLHMTPLNWVSPRTFDDMPLFNYDPCLFHLLIRPSTELQKEIDRQFQKIGKTVGIHFRTGDAVAFDIAAHDVRVSTDLNQALDRLVQCARKLAKRQGIDNATRFYLATDNRQVVELAMAREELITLDLSRHSWMHYDDFDAWLEVFLLSRMAGIVANELDRRNNTYLGGADRISTFARLAAKIGFMDERTDVHACKLH